MGPNGRCECSFCGNMPLCGSRGYTPLNAPQLADQVFGILEALPEENRIKFSQKGAGDIKVPQGIDATVLAEDIKFLGGQIKEDGSIKL